MANDKILITGATDGIGKQTALELAQMGYSLVLHGRNPDRGKEIVDMIKANTDNASLDYINADLSSLQEVGELASKVKEKHPDLNVLLNNAGVFQRQKEYTIDGFEKTFAVNHLAVFKLTLELIELLKKNKPSRIITVASMAHQSGDIDFGNLNAEKHFSDHTAYSLSKACNILFTYRLAKKLENTGVITHCLHPGVIGTKLLHAGWGGGIPVSEGAGNTVFVTTDPEVGEKNGKYYMNKQEKRSASITYNTDYQQKLWEMSLEMVNMKDPLP